MKKEDTKKVLVRKINAEINFSEFKTSDSLPKTAATISARTFEYLDRSEYLTYQDSSFSGEDLIFLLKKSPLRRNIRQVLSSPK